MKSPTAQASLDSQFVCQYVCLNIYLSYFSSRGLSLILLHKSLEITEEKKDEAIYISFNKFICIISTCTLHTLKYDFRTSFNPN